MKRKFLFCLAVMAIAVGAAFNLNVNSQMKGTSNLTKANIEALAEPEKWVYLECTVGYTTDGDKDHHYDVEDYYCGSCTFHWVRLQGDGFCNRY